MPVKKRKNKRTQEYRVVEWPSAEAIGKSVTCHDPSKLIPLKVRMILSSTTPKVERKGKIRVLMCSVEAVVHDKRSADKMMTLAGRCKWREVGSKKNKVPPYEFQVPLFRKEYEGGYGLLTITG